MRHMSERSMGWAKLFVARAGWWDGLTWQCSGNREVGGSKQKFLHAQPTHWASENLPGPNQILKCFCACLLMSKMQPGPGTYEGSDLRPHTYTYWKCWIRPDPRADGSRPSQADLRETVASPRRESTGGLFPHSNLPGRGPLETEEHYSLQ